MGILNFALGGLIGGLSDNANTKAANQARDAITQASDADRALYERIYNQSRGDLAPYNQAGQEALNALRVRMGLAPMNAAGAPPAASYRGPQTTGGSGPLGASAGAPNGASPRGYAGANAPTGPLQYASDSFGATVAGKDAAREPGLPRDVATAAGGPPAPGGQPDFAAYGAGNPDLQAEWQNIVNTGNADGFGNDPNAYYAWHYQQYGQDEGRALPTSGGPQGPQTPADPNAPPPEYFSESYADRPADMEVPTFQRQPDLAAPGAFKYTPQDIENDVGYRFARDEALGGVNAFSAARGKLRSGDAAKALQDRAAGVAHQWDNDYFNRALSTFNVNTDAYRYGQNRNDRTFSEDRGYGTDLWNTRQTRGDNIFSEDRGFAADRFDQGTANLFGLTSAGQGAAAGTAAAGNVFARGASDANQTAAAARANATLLKNQTNPFATAAKFAGAYFGGGF